MKGNDHNGRLVSERQARDIFREDFLGPGELEAALGIPARLYKAPPIPFDSVSLLWAKNRGFFLVLRVNIGRDGRPLTLQKLNHDAQDIFDARRAGRFLYRDGMQYDEDPFFSAEYPALGWALTMKELLPGTLGKNYLGQSEEIADYLVNSPLRTRLPDLGAAIADFLVMHREEIRTFLRYSEVGSSALLRSVLMTRRVRPSAVEALYDMAFYFLVSGKRMLADSYAWTSSLSLSRNFVKVGKFDEAGIDINALRSVSYAAQNLGALVSLAAQRKQPISKR
jgi:hypothetical protein